MSIKTNNTRLPDEVTYDQLLEDTRSDFDKQIEQAINLSITDLEQHCKDQLQYENQLINEHITEYNKRNDIFKELKFNLIRIGKFDPEIQNVHNILNPIINAYCNQYIETYEIDPNAYYKIVNTLKHIKNSKQALDALQTIMYIKQ